MKKFKITSQTQKTVWFDTIAIVDAEDSEEAEEKFKDYLEYQGGDGVKIIQDELEVENDYQGCEIIDIEEVE